MKIQPLMKTMSSARIGLVVISSALALPVRPNHSQTVVRVAELSLRKAATKIVMPEFPQESIKRRASGVAVVQILFDAQGGVIKTKVLEAPDSLTGNAVVVAVRQWKFQPQRVNGESVYIRGKLTFYFVIDRPGVGHVVNPKQVS